MVTEYESVSNFFDKIRGQSNPRKQKVLILAPGLRVVLYSGGVRRLVTSHMKSEVRR